MLLEIICLLVAISGGFIWGRHSGLREGEQRGKAYAPLELRAEALTQGICPVCESKLEIENGSPLL